MGENIFNCIINQITLPDSGEIFDGENCSPNTFNISDTSRREVLYTSMKVGEQCLYLAQNERAFYAQLNI
jgi:ABC-2 type transport system ATP-binding protein